MPPVKLYAPERFRTELSHITLLVPFWGAVAKESTPFVRAAERQYGYSADDFALVPDIHDADYVVVPYSYERLKTKRPELLSRIIREAAEAGKPLLIDGAGDIEYPIAIKNSVILRVSQYRYRAQENEITVPFPAEDLLESYAGGTFAPRAKTERPSVAFAGWADLSLKQSLVTWLKELPVTAAELVHPERGAEHKGVLFRERALKALRAASAIDTHFLIRGSYSGHTATMQGSPEALRKAFVENLRGADYALSVKGDANSSVRFYEALSLGRIPLFLDTACVLPLEDKINYKDFCVFVDWQDVSRMGEALASFHNALSPEGFEAMQKKARETFRDHLRLDSYSHELAELLRNRAHAHRTA